MHNHHITFHVPRLFRAYLHRCDFSFVSCWTILVFHLPPPSISHLLDAWRSVPMRMRDRGQGLSPQLASLQSRALSSYFFPHSLASLHPLSLLVLTLEEALKRSRRKGRAMRQPKSAIYYFLQSKAIQSHTACCCCRRTTAQPPVCVFRAIFICTWVSASNFWTYTWFC